MNLNILLDALGFSHLSNKYFIDEKYNITTGRFEKESAASVSVSFGRELQIIFRKMDSTTTSSTSSPLPSIKSYTAFNASETHSGVKQC